MAGLDELRQQLRRYDPERYPVQHATAQFHLGVMLLQGGELEEAAAALRTAEQLFAPLPVEQAKARNMLGAVRRQQGAIAEATDAFSAAAAVFDQQDMAQEHGAALYNLGLVHVEAGRFAEAATCFDDAERRFAAEKLGGQSAAAARELGTTQLSAGDLEAAVEALERAMDLAERTLDEPGRGAAANALGLAHLASQHSEDAVEAFQTAVGTNPRNVRPEGYAMAKANLALALERAGDVPRARLAARQALGVRAGVPGPVATQAADILDRLGTGTDELHDVLDTLPSEQWPAVLREELARWLDADVEERQAAAGAWIDGQLTRAAQGADLAYVLLDVVLELPPSAMETLITALLDALDSRDDQARERFRSDMSRAMIRFHGPQWLRMKDLFNRIATERGEAAAWG